MKKSLGTVSLVWFLLPWFLSDSRGDDMVEVTASIIPVGQKEIKGLSQLELRREVALASGRDSRELLRFAVVVESGKWATLKRGREFWYPAEYSESRVHPAGSDDGVYSVPSGPPAPGNSSIVLPNSPMGMTFSELGAQLRVRASIREGGLIFLEGQLRDVSFEGLSGEAIPITVKTRHLVGGDREIPIVDSHIGQPVFLKVDESFSVMLPYAAGSSANAALLREAQREYSYFVPMELGNNVFGAHGKIELNTQTPDPKGIIRSTMMKASQIKDFFIRPREKPEARDHGILVLNVRKIPPAPPGVANSQSGKILVETRLFESDSQGLNDQPVLSPEEFEQAMKNLAVRKGVTAISTPQLVLSSGQSGKIEAIREFVFPNAFRPPALDPSIAKGFPFQPGVPISFQTRRIGLTMDIKAIAETGGKIRLAVDCSQTEVEGLLNFGVPVYVVKTQLVKKIKPVVASENQAEAPVLPFRRAITELLVPSGSAVAMTMIFDYHNKNHRKEGFLKVVGRGKNEEVQSPRYLTVFVRPRYQ